ncbi:SAM-dependent methyltransferase [Putridiphycobacter roseus]|uniref:SAM-dependent methyltransferase n=1 Tax=Putridiphycobacter roseus TaxID=2219161 RepID=A0A2W1N026_9FLAO|nr:class I SAM-dependent methyltransferase [Putridiphycobacter roseus]PZE17044.1 SAM-dependent methyltransferase [Putridiphycobacter roseus]
MKNWFESWFDTKYYHILYKDRDLGEAEFFIENLTKELALPQNTKILDLACGKGRHAKFLNKLGFDVVGVDLSAASIDYAKRMENSTLHFFEHDMRKPLPGHEFDCVFNLFTSIGYFEDQDDNIKMLHAVHSYLKPKGNLIIDFLNVAQVERDMLAFETKQIEGIDFNISKSIVNNVIEKTIRFKDQGKDYEYHERVHALTLENFEYFLNAADFEIVKTVGDYNLTDFNVGNSDRLIIFAKKR